MIFNNRKIIDLRRSLHMKQRELAAIAGIKAPALCQWEKGTRVPSGQFLVRLADALGVEPKYFFD